MPRPVGTEPRRVCLMLAAVTLSAGASGCHILAGFDDLEVRGGELGWSASFGDELDQQAKAIAVDDSGHVVIAGTFGGRTNFGGAELVPQAGVTDLFVAKFDPAGTHLWSHSFGCSDDGLETVTGVAIDHTGAVTIVGQFHDSLLGLGPQTDCPTDTMGHCSYVAKLDPGGGHRWTLHLAAAATGLTPVPHITLRAVATDRLAGGPGDVVIAGELAGTLPWTGETLTAERNGNVFVGKLAGDTGEPRWATHFGDEQTQLATSVAVATDSGSIVVGGEFSGTIQFANGAYDAANVDLFVAELQADGQHGWISTYGTDGAVLHGPKVSVDYLGGVALSGYYDGEITLGGEPLESDSTHDVFVAALSQAGHYRWSSRGNLAQSPLCSLLNCELHPLSIAMDNHQDVVVAGTFSRTLDVDATVLTSSGERDAFLAKRSSAGELVWAHNFGHAQGNADAIVAVSGSGDVFVAGSFERSIDLGGGPLHSSGGTDVYLARFNP